MPPALHLIIPHALRPAGAPAAPLPGLPRLQRLLALLKPAPAGIACSEADFSLPAERLEASLRGLPDADGRIPWAAWDMALAGGAPGAHAWAWISPCYWRVGADHIAMDDPASLQLDEADSRALLAAVAPYFEEDGITLLFHSAHRWLARGELFADLACASLDRVIGRRLAPWMPRGTASARTMQRLQQEMQMLLYTHPVNDRRQAAGLLPVNSCWVSGAGRLPSAAPASEIAPGNPAVRVDGSLRAPALAGDAVAWARAWQGIDDSLVAQSLDALRQGTHLDIILGGESLVRRWVGSQPGLLHRALAPARLPTVRQILEHND